MKKILLAVALLCGISSAQAIKIIHGPYLQCVGEREATIVWVTDVPAMSWVELAADDGTHFYQREQPKYYETYLGKRVIGTLHKVRITNLEPGKRYRYAVASKEVLKTKHNRIHFGSIAATNVYSKGANYIPTLNPTKESFEFLVLNDIHAKQDRLEALLNCYQKDKTDLVFYNGDMVSYVPSEQMLFEGFVDASVKRFAKDVPFYLVRGNHETRGIFATSYLNYFPTPTNKPYFTMKHGDVFFIVLDGGEDKPDSNLEYYETARYDEYRKEEAEWLKKVVASEECKNAKYRVVLMHMPPVGGKHMWHGPKHAGECFFPILNEANIAVMLSAHTHRYSYHAPLDGTDAKFPILVNSNKCALKAYVNGEGIKIEVVDEAGAVQHTHSFK